MVASLLHGQFAWRPLCGGQLSCTVLDNTVKTTPTHLQTVKKKIIKKKNQGSFIFSSKTSFLLNIVYCNNDHNMLSDGVR